MTWGRRSFKGLIMRKLKYQREDQALNSMLNFTLRKEGKRKSANAE